MAVCPRCSSKSYVNMYVDETKCMMCSYVGNKIPREILQEFIDNKGLQGSGDRYIRQNSKKYYP